MKPTVYIVHHVDTEGPLYEDISETFKRIEEILNIKIPLIPNIDNLNKLRNGEIDFLSHSQIEEINKIINPHLLNYKSSWAEIDEMLNRILDRNFRNKFKDSFGGGWIYNWHIMDHAGFEVNPRRRDLGYLNIFDHYESILKSTGSINLDEIEWHFHPVHHSKIANLCATSYENCYNVLHQILTRRIIEKNWFPRVNRAGMHTERPDSHWFLEQWIPFDASNQSIENDDYCTNGRFGDWYGAPSDWSIYRPDFYDWRKEGNCNRWISRVLNLKTRFRNITEKEIEKAFVKAQNENRNVYLGITDHDFRELSSEIEEFYSLLKKVASRFDNVNYKFSGTKEAFKEVLKLDSNKNLKISLTLKNNLLTINILEGEIFGPQPYLAIKTKEGQYFHDNLDFSDTKNKFYYTFDMHTLPLSIIETIKVCSNDKYGNQCIVTL